MLAVVAVLNKPIAVDDEAEPDDFQVPASVPASPPALVALVGMGYICKMNLIYNICYTYSYYYLGTLPGRSN
jgi:hypothetical protein